MEESVAQLASVSQGTKAKLIDISDDEPRPYVQHKKPTMAEIKSKVDGATFGLAVAPCFQSELCMTGDRDFAMRQIKDFKTLLHAAAVAYQRCDRNHPNLFSD